MPAGPRAGGGPSRPQSASEQRPEEGAVDDRDALVGVRVELREQPHPGARQRRVEHEPAVGGVVVGDEDDRPRGVGIAGLGHHVPGRAVRQRGAPEPEPAAAHVVVDRRRGERAHERGRQAAEPGGQRRRPRSAARAATSSRRVRAPPPLARRGSPRPRTRPPATRPPAARRPTPRAARRRRARGRPARSGLVGAMPLRFPMRSAVVGWSPKSSWRAAAGPGRRCCGPRSGARTSRSRPGRA